MQLKYILQTVCVFIIFGLLVFLCYLCDVSQRKNIEEYKKEIAKYEFLDTEMSEYICTLCKSLDLDSDLVVAHLIAENPQFDVNAKHLNGNGTTDLGLFQLNDRYLFTTFKDKYWKETYEIDPFNWQHNTYIAIHLIKDLQDKFENQDDAIMAYNGGSGAVMTGNIKPLTRYYLQKVNLNLQFLKEKKD